MINLFIDENESFDIYKYRGNTSIFNNLLSIGIRKESATNIYTEEHEKFQKKYTILQDTRSESHNAKLRYILLIYSTSSWKVFMLSVLIIAYLLDTWLYTFCHSNNRPLSIIIIVICLNLIFTLDVAIVFGLKFFKKWRKTLNLVEPNITRVIIDVILAIPYSVLYLCSYKNEAFDYHIIVPIAAVARDYRILEFFYNKSSQAGRNQWSTFLLQYLILFLISVHSCTCVWFLFSYHYFDINKIRMSWTISASHLPRETVLDWYFVCAYVSVMWLTTNALGDIYPIVTGERIFATITVLLGFLLTTIVFVGSLTSQFITITAKRSKYISHLKKIQNHLRLIKMDTKTTNHIMRLKIIYSKFLLIF